MQDETPYVPVFLDAYGRPDTPVTPKLRKALRLVGTPGRIEFRTGDNPFKGRKNRLTQRQISRKRRLKKYTSGRKR